VSSTLASHGSPLPHGDFSIFALGSRVKDTRIHTLRHPGHDRTRLALQFAKPTKIRTLTPQIIRAHAIDCNLRPREATVDAATPVDVVTLIDNLNLTKYD
jgi:hypothetical protein